MLSERAKSCRSVPNADSLAGWLHGVARRTAANARKATGRRIARERARATPTGTPSPEATASLRELQAILNDELARLPEVYRAAFLLCHIEGHSRSEAAELVAQRGEHILVMHRAVLRYFSEAVG